MKYSVFLINLARNKDRLNSSASKLSESGVCFKRIDAIDGRKLQYSSKAICYSEDCNKFNYYKKMNLGEIGCYESHRKVWKEIISKDLDFALILEDDFNIIGEVGKLVTFLEKLTTPWDYIKLAEGKRVRKEATVESISGYRLVRYEKVPSGTWAQAVSIDGAKKLLGNSSEYGRPVDVDIQHFWESKLRVYGVKPYTFEPSDTISEIDLIGIRDQAEKSAWKRFVTTIQFYFLNNYHRRKF